MGVNGILWKIKDIMLHLLKLKQTHEKWALT